MAKINELNYIDEQCWFNYKEFYNVISSQNFDTLVEVGVWKGSSISYLASRNRQSKIYAVDLFENTYKYATQEEILKDVKNIKEIYNQQLHKTNTRHIITDIIDYSWNGALYFDDASLDFVFIDADHSYESVMKDLFAWFPKIKKGKIFAGHDYGVHQNPMFPEKTYNFPGVKKAVDEFFKTKNRHVNTYEGGVWWIEL
jgi:predicted O-methyltransferase YrrM